MSKVAGKEIVHRETVMVFDGQIAEIGFAVGLWPFKLSFSFEPTVMPRGIKSVVAGDRLVWTFHNWDESLGMAFNEPIEVAKLNTGDRVECLVRQTRTGSSIRWTSSSPWGLEMAGDAGSYSPTDTFNPTTIAAKSDAHAKVAGTWICGLVVVILAVAGGIVFVTHPENAKDTWVVIGPIISALATGLLGKSQK